MDPVRFDALARVLLAPDSRRRILGLLTAVPAVGGLLGLYTLDDTDAAGRRKRRKKAHKHGKGRRRKHKKKKPTCTPTTCAAQGTTCGSIPDGCGKALDCGPCTCATDCHSICQTCNLATGQCDPVANDTPCDDGDLCTVNPVCTDGVCSGSPTCASGQGCVAGVCCLLPTDTSATQGLQEAIDGTQSGDTIRLCAGTWNLTSTVRIGKNLTLVGAGAAATALDGNNAVGVIWIEPEPDNTTVTVSLQDLTIRKGNAGFGGGIYNGGLNSFLSTLNLLRVNVTGNTATLAGGGIYNDRSTLTVEDGSVIGGAAGEGNTATQSGGGIFNNGGTLTLKTGSRVTGNTATNGQGGGITNAAGTVPVPAGTVTIDAGAIICSNTPLNSQCSGGFTGLCPAPSETCPS